MISASSREDFIKELYNLQNKKNRAAKVQELAKSLNIRDASVSEMARKLKADGIVIIEPYSGLSLSKRGISLARGILRKHQLLEIFLSEILGIKNKLMHVQAHVLEHGLSEQAADKLDKLLGNPRKCPDDNDIPNLKKVTKSMYEVKKNSFASVLFCNASKGEILKRVNAIGLFPKTRFKVVSKIPRGPLIIRLEGSEIAVGRNIAEAIFVEE